MTFNCQPEVEESGVQVSAYLHCSHKEIIITTKVHRIRLLIYKYFHSQLWRLLSQLWFYKPSSLSLSFLVKLENICHNVIMLGLNS